MKKNKNIYQNTSIANGKINLTELARLTLLNILSVRGVIYTHYKNKKVAVANACHTTATKKKAKDWLEKKLTELS